MFKILVEGQCSIRDNLDNERIKELVFFNGEVKWMTSFFGSGIPSRRKKNPPLEGPPHLSYVFG